MNTSTVGLLYSALEKVNRLDQARNLEQSIDITYKQITNNFIKNLEQLEKDLNTSLNYHNTRKTRDNIHLDLYLQKHYELVELTKIIKTFKSFKIEH